MEPEKNREVPSPWSRNAFASENLPIEELYQGWFLDYASYVILERAVPLSTDGLKPVQRRLLYAMKTVEDGRYNKVANLIGTTMQYHPHGDASIADALVHLGQKDLLIDTQGNWGNLFTGDAAAAPRYIEARLSKLALEVMFNEKTTPWQRSYDGRKQEPMHLPVKFPLLLTLGTEGIAVGLSTKIFPHNPKELLKASIQLLKGKPVTLYPDFPQGSIADVSQYRQGQRGGKVRVRAKIDIQDKKTLNITELPYGLTTQDLIDTILKAHEKGKLKIKSVVDNTAESVDILVHLSPQQSAEETLKALYAFTSCEISLSPCACVIRKEKPVFTTVESLLEESTQQTQRLLEQELQIRQKACQEDIFFASLEKIFILHKMYRQIENSDSFEKALNTLDKALKPYAKQFYRAITQDDIVKLTEIRIKRISKYNSNETDKKLSKLKKEAKEIAQHLSNMTHYTIAYFQHLLKNYGQHWPRKTKLESLESVEAQTVALANQRLFMNRKEGFVGTGTSMKKEEFALMCSDLDDIVVFNKNTEAKVLRVGEKVFVGKNIVFLARFDKDQTYHMIYKDTTTGIVRAKRFRMGGITREKNYLLGSEKSQIIYLCAAPSGQAELVELKLSPHCRAKKKVVPFDFSTLSIKGRTSQGNILTKYPVARVRRTARKESTQNPADGNLFGHEGLDKSDKVDNSADPKRE